LTPRPGHSRLLRRHFLTPSERVLLETHPSKWFYFPWPTVAAFVVLVLDYLALARAYPGLPQVPKVSHWLATLPYSAQVPWTIVIGGVASLLTVCVALWIAYRVYRWAGQTYAVTDDRIVEQKGIVRHVIQEIPIRQIRDVDVYQKKLTARVLRYGTLRFKSLSEIDSPDYLVDSAGMRAVPGPGAVKSRFDLLEHTYDPEDELARASGVEWWVGVPNPFRIERTIEDLLRNAPTMGAPAPPAPPPR
jgi:hypothetical protein